MYGLNRQGVLVGFALGFSFFFNTFLSSATKAAADAAIDKFLLQRKYYMLWIPKVMLQESKY